MQDIFTFKQTGVDSRRRGQGPLPGHRRAAALLGAAEGPRHRLCPSRCSTRRGGWSRRDGLAATSCSRCCCSSPSCWRWRAATSSGLRSAARRRSARRPPARDRAAGAARRSLSIERAQAGAIAGPGSTPADRAGFRGGEQLARYVEHLGHGSDAGELVLLSAVARRRRLARCRCCSPGRRSSRCCSVPACWRRCPGSALRAGATKRIRRVREADSRRRST